MKARSADLGTIFITLMYIIRCDPARQHEKPTWNELHVLIAGVLSRGDVQEAEAVCAALRRLGGRKA